MALDCTPGGLNQGAKCIECLTHKQLLAAMVYLLCTQNNMNCTPASLMAGAKCIMCLTEKQLIAAMVYLQCTGGGGGVPCGNYGGAKPPASAAPSGGCGPVIDTSNGRVWWYYNGDFH